MKKKITLILTMALVMTFIIAQTGCAKKDIEPVSKENYALDTVCTITVYHMKDMTKERALEVIDGAYKECSKYEDMLSNTIETSDIWKINHSEGKSIKCSKETIKMLREGIKYSKMSKGTFDITIGNITDLWDFHGESQYIPLKTLLDEKVKDVDYRNIVIKGDKVYLKDSKAKIDLGGIAKGYIADRMAEYLEKNGVTGAIINLGGNVYAVGHKDGESKDFNVGIKKPFTEDGKIIGTSKISDATIVTSGPYERYFKVDGRIYHHILNPKTGYPVESDLYSVTIIGPKGTSSNCDALATTCYILGPEKGVKYINKLGKYTAIFYTKDGKIIKSNDKFNFQEIKDN